MHTAGILQSSEAEQSQLWRLTWDRIDTFLPTLKEEVFKPHQIGKELTFLLVALREFVKHMIWGKINQMLVYHLYSFELITLKT